MKDNVRSKHLGKKNNGEKSGISDSAEKKTTYVLRPKETKEHCYAAGSLKRGSS